MPHDTDVLGLRHTHIGVQTLKVSQSYLAAAQSYGQVSVTTLNAYSR